MKQTAYFSRILLVLFTLLISSTPLILSALPNNNVECAGLCTTTKSITLETLYGTFEIDEPVILEILESAPFQRLKNVYQLGIWRYAVKDDNFTRYDHSIGVFALVRKYGGSLKEQIAALLHDVSHTVFSHVGAFFFVSDAKAMDKFQDDTHEWYLEHTGLAAILHKYGYTVEEILPKHPEFKRLEQDLPMLCADRIDYNIRGALWDNLITAEQAKNIVESLAFDNDTWYFTDQQCARKIAETSCSMTSGIWGSAENFLTGQWLAKALKRAVQLDLITRNDVYFSTDTAVWKILCSSGDPELQKNIYQIEHCYDFFVIDDQNFTEICYGKFRGINPLVKTEDGLQHLTDIDPEYAQIYNSTKEIITKGWKVRIL